MYQVPLIMGHEFSGDVIESGQNITDIKLGDMVCGINVSIVISEGGNLDVLIILKYGGFAE